MNEALTIGHAGWSPDFKADNAAFKQAVQKFLIEKKNRDNQSVLLEGFSSGWIARRAPADDLVREAFFAGHAAIVAETAWEKWRIEHGLE